MTHAMLFHAAHLSLSCRPIPRHLVRQGPIHSVYPAREIAMPVIPVTIRYTSPCGTPVLPSLPRYRACGIAAHSQQEVLHPFQP
jgi:hypothetical protein